MIPVDFTAIINPRSKGVVEFCAPEFDPTVLSSDTDLALIRFPQDMHIDVRWEKDSSAFYVILFKNQFTDVLAERECRAIADLSFAVRELSDQVFYHLVDSPKTADVSFGAISIKPVSWVASDTHDANPITYEDRGRPYSSRLQPTV